MKKLNVGCGRTASAGWINIDLYVEGEGIIKMDARALKFEDESIDVIYTSHTLEHLAFRDVPTALKEFYRVLKKGGQLEVAVPDLEWVLRNFLDTPEREKWGFPLETIFGAQGHEGDFHRCGFTFPRLVALLEEQGFKIVEKKNIWSCSVQSLWVCARKGST